MLNVLITSSVLILVLILLRGLLRGKISLRFQYALWLLVAVRLLVPVSFGSTSISVLNAVDRAGERQAVQTVPSENQVPPVSQTVPVTVPAQSGTAAVTPAAPDRPHTQALTAAQIAGLVWAVGAAAMAGVFLVSNLAFRRRLRRGAVPVDVPGCPVPVYQSAAAPTPCLVGLVRPRIYLTPECAGDGQRLRHVLAHELTHRRHGDPVWSLVRCLCLTLYWYHPLVWAAAILSRRDCELSCDEGALARLGEGERAAYGRTLLSLVVPRTTPTDLLCTATTMSSGKRGLMERITLIAKRPRMMALTLALAVLVSAVAVGCTFTGAKDKNGLPDASLPIESRVAELSAALKEQVTVEQGGLTEGESGTLATYYLTQDYNTDWGGLMCSVSRVTQVEFEQGYDGGDVVGGVSYLGRDADWYYRCDSPTDVQFNPEHQAEYEAATTALDDWLGQVFGSQEGVTAMADDPSYQTLSAAISYPGDHVNVLYRPYYGLLDYGTKQDIRYTLLLSRPVRQGDGGIWCVDRWYDENGNCYRAVPQTDLTLAEYYQGLQDQCDQGHETALLDPVQVAVAYEETWNGHLSPVEAFTVGEVYTGEPQIEPTAITANEGVANRMAAIMGTEADSVKLTLETGWESTSFIVLSHAGNGVNFSSITGDYDWTDALEEAYFAGGDLTPADQSYSVTVSAADDSKWFRFWPDSDVVLYSDQTGKTWYHTVRTGPEDPWDMTAIMRRWFDETEFTANIEEYAVLSTASTDYTTIATEWGEALGAAIRRSSPGSEYEVRDARCNRVEIMETDPADDSLFVFSLYMALDPVDPTGIGFMAGAGLDEITEGAYAGYWSWFHEVVLRRTNGVWRLEDWGTGGYRLADHK